GDHSADRGAVRRRQLRCKEQTVGQQRLVQLVLDDTGLHACPAFLDIDLEDPGEIAGELDHESFAQRLAVGAGTAAARAQHDLLKARFGEEPADALQILDRLRKDDSLRHDLIDRVVGRQHLARGTLLGKVAFKSGRCQRRQKSRVKLHGLVIPDWAEGGSTAFRQQLHYLLRESRCSTISAIASGRSILLRSFAGTLPWFCWTSAMASARRPTSPISS